MGGVLARAKQVLSQAIMNTQEIILRNNVRATFSINIMAYRNYSSQGYALVVSGFQNDPRILTTFLYTIDPSGGQGQEALELVYRKVNQIQQVDQVIIIGDARCNNLYDMMQKRNSINPSKEFWTSLNIPFVQSLQQQLNKLLNRKIPIHSLYITTGNQHIKEYFEEISNASEGFCQQFMINRFDASEKLADFIAKNILNKIGGQSLVDDYFRMRRG